MSGARQSKPGKPTETIASRQKERQAHNTVIVHASACWHGINVPPVLLWLCEGTYMHPHDSGSQSQRPSSILSAKERKKITESHDDLPIAPPPPQWTPHLTERSHHTPPKVSRTAPKSDLDIYVIVTKHVLTIHFLTNTFTIRASQRDAETA